MGIVYLAGSLAGIALLVGLNLLLFGRVRPSLGDAQSIAARLAREVPRFRAGAVALSEDGRCALVEDAVHHALYLVEAQGADAVTRKLTPSLVHAVRHSGREIAITLADYTLPEARLRLADDVAAQWARKLAVRS